MKEYYLTVHPDQPLPEGWSWGAPVHSYAHQLRWVVCEDGGGVIVREAPEWDLLDDAEAEEALSEAIKISDEEEEGEEENG